MNQVDPQLIVHRVEDLQWHEVRSQQIGDRRTSVWNRFVDITDDRTVAYTRYDAGVMLPRHSHHSDEVIYIIEGEVTVGDQSWPAGTAAVLEAGKFFGPLVAGPEGALLFEVFTGRADRAGQDRSGFAELLEAKGSVELPEPPFTLPPRRSRGEAAPA
jgi:hypothetical protein